MTRAALLALVTVLLSGCGGSGLRADLSAAGNSVGKIRSGDLDFSMLVTPHAARAKHPFGWKLRGPFSFGDVPTARIVYTQIANGHTASSTLVLDTSGAYAVNGGAHRSLSSANVQELRTAAARVRQGASIDVSKWLKSTSSCGKGCAEGNLDVAAAANTLLEISGSHGTLNAANAKRLADAARSATYRIEWTPKQLLRDLKLHVDLGFDAPPKLRAALGKLVGATFDLHLGVQHPQT
ncbi:MAG TPA: hypothetical protein VGO39_00815 [Gaiellaceae bacterium]|nr:hypothetical protein [Gaiellaceae bacterium]